MAIKGGNMDGQMSIFDFPEYLPEEKQKIVKPIEAPILLEEGQHVWNTVKGDVEEYIFDGRHWALGKENRGYSLERVTYGGTVCWNTSFGKDFFLNREDAEKKAKENLENISHILAADIKPVKTVAYEFEYLGRRNIYFYCILEDGSIYRHSDGTYEHISKNPKIDIETFERGKASKIKNGDYVKDLENYVPEFKNMYQCSKHDNWIYAEAHYEHFNI